MYFVPGSQYEPIHAEVRQPEDTEEHQPNLIEVVDVEREREVPAPAMAGDVVFFGGHVLHRSGRNRSTTRFRRAFVGHYANARSYTEWGGGNKNQILARGSTHLDYALPKFDTGSRP